MFKVGDKVICVTPGYWTCDITWTLVPGPFKGEELVVYGISSDGCLIFEKYGVGDDEGYDSDDFRKLNKKPFTNAITKELANQPIVEERVEEVRELETV